MAIENMMYFALGLLLAALVATILVPAVWQRAVRLTKKRIEAATPISMAEFRAEKDQLRAEHALAMRRMETTIETLRKRLANELKDTNRRAVEADLATQRRAHQSVVAELEAREDKLRRRALDLEKEVASLSHRLRKRERDLEERNLELRALRGQASAPVAAPVAVALPVQEPVIGDTPAPLAQPDATADPVAALAALHRQITDLESRILSGWDAADTDRGGLRNELIAIAGSVAGLPENPPAAR